MSRSEAFPGVVQWEKFAATCAKAEAKFADAVAKAKHDRDVVLAPNTWSDTTIPDRIKPAADRRYRRAKRAAREKRDRDIKTAEDALMKALDA